MENIGIDGHKRDSQVCILGEGGKVVLEQRVRTQRERLGELLSKRPKARVLLEASTESEWVARCLEGWGHEEEVVADPNFAPMYATRSRRVKTDKRDARTLAEACRLGAYRPAHRTSDEQRHMRAQLATREALVRTRTRSISLVRALVRREGLRVADGEAESSGPDLIGGRSRAFPSVHRTSALCLGLRYVSAQPKRASGPRPEARQPPARGEAALDGWGALRRP